MSSALEAELGYAFRDPDLLRIALAHRSFSNERGEKDNYERLEFLGDSGAVYLGRPVVLVMGDVELERRFGRR